MNETFPEFLNQIHADRDMIQQAFRLYLSERTEDLTREEMLTELKKTATNEEELQRQLKLLEQDPDTIEQAALIYFDHAWQDDVQKPFIRSAFTHAKGKLPVIELGILAVVAMYGMYLLTTQGITEVTVERKPNGSYARTEKREPFAPIMSVMGRLFGKIG